jgi:hypothetical protein
MPTRLNGEPETAIDGLSPFQLKNLPSAIVTEVAPVRPMDGFWLQTLS